MHKAAGITNRKATLHKIEGIPDHSPKPWHTPPMYPFPLYSFVFISFYLGYRWRDSNPHSPFGKTDFKSVVSTNSTTAAFVLELHIQSYCATVFFW